MGSTIGLAMSDSELSNLTLIQIEAILKRNNRSLMDYPPMPCPVGEVEDGRYGDFSNNNLINAELLYDKVELESSYWRSTS
ncbi:hypothetical protein PIB30_099580, partial [Stylosanthes scabra]|nr:hypothetical protein [Stylosanthes scabra]